VERRVYVILVRIAMNALPEKQKEVMQTLLSMVESTGKEKGCLSHQVFRDIEEENVFSLIVGQIRSYPWNKEPFMRTPEHSNPHGFRFGRNGGCKRRQG
jgi:hypothetical protein